MKEFILVYWFIILFHYLMDYDCLNGFTLGCLAFSLFWESILQYKKRNRLAHPTQSFYFHYENTVKSDQAVISVNNFQIDLLPFDMNNYETLSLSYVAA